MKKVDQNVPDTQPEQPPELVKRASYFRVKGLIGFALTLFLVIGLMFVFAGPLIKLGIEEGGSWYWGAEVNVASVDVQWSPFELSLGEVEVTDPHEPSQNVVALEQVMVKMDLWQAILGKTLIHNLEINKVDLNKRRASPGVVTKVPAKSDNASEASTFDSAMTALPGIDELMARSDLKTLQAGAKLHKTYQTEKAAIEVLAKKLPDAKTIAEYQRSINKLSNSESLSPADITEFRRLMAQIESDMTLLQEAKAQLSTSNKNIKIVLKDVKNAPAEDWEKLSQQYQFNEGGAQNFAELIFGQQAKQYLQMAQNAYNTLKPILDKLNKDKAAEVEEAQLDLDEGYYVHFAEDVPMPDWLVEKTLISMNLEQGGFAIEIDELTAQHWMRNKPTKLIMTSNNLLSTGVLQLNADFYMAEQAGVTANADWDVAGLTLQQLPISDSKSLNLVMSEAKLNVKGTATFANQELDNQNQLAFSESAFTGESDNIMGRAMVKVLQGMSEMSVDIGAKGEVLSPDLSIRSELDKQIFAGIKGAFKDELKVFKGKAMDSLGKKLTEQIGGNSNEAQDMANYDGTFDTLEGQLTELLKSKLQDSITNKAKGLLKGLFN